MWFQSLNYKFYQPEADDLIYRKAVCSKNETFLEMSQQKFLEITNELYERKVPIDVVFAPSHIDPNAMLWLTMHKS